MAELIRPRWRQAANSGMVAQGGEFVSDVDHNECPRVPPVPANAGNRIPGRFAVLFLFFSQQLLRMDLYLSVQFTFAILSP